MSAENNNEIIDEDEILAGGTNVEVGDEDTLLQEPMPGNALVRTAPRWTLPTRWAPLQHRLRYHYQAPQPAHQNSSRRIR